MSFQGFIAVKGAKQGQFKGESTNPAQGDLIPILNFQNQVSLPIDHATGAASGTRQHTPIVVTKQWGAASPQFFQALVTSEILQTVELTFNRVGSDGNEATYFTIDLVNAVVVEIHQYVGSAPGLTDNPNALEDISLTYQKIKISDLDAQTSATDDWLV
jgi:type VI secretion system secreted protein Hcp